MSLLPLPGTVRARRQGPLIGLRSVIRRWELASRPVDPAYARALRRRWSELPPSARTPAQTLGQHALGCEGTHGVFPRCNLACTPCYHSRDANRVATDGGHTLRQVRAQMAFLQEARGPRAHAQLIGGEASLLSPDDHAAALQAMRAAGREPMSMSHGDFDYDYLRAVAVGPDGRRRLGRVSFAGHFDSMMFGRRGIARPRDEASLNPHRAAFTAMFRRLRTEHGVRSFLAHTMTVTPDNLDQVAQVVRDNHAAGFGMFSFQPAAFLGDERRWRAGYRETTADQVWSRIEAGVGARLPFRALQTGDERCNRSTFGFYAGERYVPILDDRDPADLRVRDLFYRHLGGVDFAGTAPPLLAVKLLRVVVRRPRVLASGAAWAVRTGRRAGILQLIRHPRIRPVAFVMHSFMDAEEVRPAWAASQKGVRSSEPAVAATQERLAACAYTMAHPETGELVPACVQHALLDPEENRRLRDLLPLTVVHAGERRA